MTGQPLSTTRAATCAENGPQLITSPATITWSTANGARSASTASRAGRLPCRSAKTARVVTGSGVSVGRRARHRRLQDGVVPRQGRPHTPRPALPWRGAAFDRGEEEGDGAAG